MSLPKFNMKNLRRIGQKFLSNFLLGLSVPFLLLLLGVSSTKSQDAQEVFSSINEPQKTPLIKTFNALTEAQYNKQWAELYDFFPIESQEGVSKAEYIRNQQKTKKDSRYVNLKTFTPTRVKKLARISDGEIWLIEGCGEWLDEGKLLKLKSHIDVYWRNEQWFLTEVLFDMGYHGSIPCNEY